MTTKRVKVHYRRLIREGGVFPAQSLRERIVAAMEYQLPNGSRVRERASNRVVAVPDQVGFERMLNTYHASGEYAFGTVCLFSPGQLQALLKVRDNDEDHGDLAELLEQLEIAEAAAPEGHEYVHGMSYWMVVHDHLYLIQHTNLQSKAMEEYFTWLLRDQTRVIGQGHVVMLQWKFDRAQVGDDDFSSIEIGGLMPEAHRHTVPDLSATTADGQIEVVATRETIGERAASTFAKAKQILVDLIGEVETDKVIENMPPEADLDVRVNIGFRARKRKLKREAMKNLEAGLRNIADGEIIARGKNGEIRGEDARLSMDMGVRRISENSSLLDPGHAFEQMREVHRRFLYDGKLGG
ncbi:MAG: hypothetical protein IM673_14570 [Phenylobacterium sp.]|uniref:hypothetical protein n=1 Tax=Phenylobacterium sp. TaxID=1871053 RepID=UPI0025EAA6FE|nr:hypothetical protein [Phenylobacterium sp.]MCA3739262.1 hypothetical protein [Phenylobacterium sp.]MCA3753646.1 hypothetical protein [Phenylobacterium sp.]MCA3758686.1 hypothetical protein [Phenylobacterium sp.]MCA4916078.1 hypothetical protein [Phenylobacterium sp.]